MNAQSRPGQGTVEFALCIPVFILLVLGIMQMALVLQANAALKQAASDATHVLAAQSDKDFSSTPDQADTRGLAAIRAALVSLTLGNVASVDVYDAGVGDAAQTTVITPGAQSVGLSAAAAFTDTVTLDNQYKPLPAGATCNVDGYFGLTNDLSSLGLGNTYKPCAPPWNGQPYDPSSNVNGRDAVRCNENRIEVRILYNYKPLPFFKGLTLQLVGQDSTTLEPTKFLQDANYTVEIPSC
jgi:Flp pilus assembly protein TadG